MTVLVFDQIRPMLHNNLGFGDQAYHLCSDAQHIEIQQDLKILTPIKKAKGQTELEPQTAGFFQSGFTD